MSRKASQYVISKDSPMAGLRDGAVLYRLTTPEFCDRECILNGEGARRGQGRFNFKGQKASYCANNAIINISEILFHVYLQCLDEILKNEGAKHTVILRKHFESMTHRRRELVVLAVQEIDNLVYAEATETPVVYAQALRGTSLVAPSRYYKPMQEFGNEVRDDGKRGIVYPSARHYGGSATDAAYVFFEDETASVKSKPYYRLSMEIFLISENENFRAYSPQKLDPFSSKLHPTMGFYRFVQPTKLAALKAKKLIYPQGLPKQGYVDFVRRRYVAYPRHAFL